jgi:hypothetical protein
MPRPSAGSCTRAQTDHSETTNAPAIARQATAPATARDSRRAVTERWRHLARVWGVNRAFVRLHTNGCGDFTLLDRETWFRLRGYPEWPIFSWAIDSVFLFQADANRLPNERLPPEQCTYHVDHGGGWTPEDQLNLFARLAQKGISVLTEQDFYRLWDEMVEKKRLGEPLVYNDPSWGFADESLREEHPQDGTGLTS